MPITSRRRAVLLWALLCFAGLPAQSFAQERIGGHFGVVIPLSTRANGVTTTSADDFVVGFPTAVSIRTGERLAFDLELVPFIQNEPLHVDLTVHPGLILSLANRFSAGVRMAFDVNRSSWGFTPLVNRSFPLAGSTTTFVELVVPIRFQIDPAGSGFTSVGVGVHAGVGF